MPLQAETNEYKAPSRLPKTHITPDPNTLISSPSPPIPSSQLYPSAPIHRTQPPHPNFRSGSYIIQLQTHPIMNLIVRKLDMILVRSIPFLKDNLSPICPGLCSDHFLPSASAIELDVKTARKCSLSLSVDVEGKYFEGFNGVVRVDFNADFLPEPVICDDFDHNHFEVARLAVSVLANCR